MTDDILRYSSFGCTYRLKLAQVAMMDSREFYKFLATVCNQETHEKSLQTLEHILTYMKEVYHSMVDQGCQSHSFTIALKRLEKNACRVCTMRALMQQELDNFRIITEAEIRRRCQRYYRDVTDMALSNLLNYYGINFPAFADMYMMGGTPVTMLYALDHQLFDMEVIEKRRRYEVDKERRPTN